ncbi:murein hydrolase activator EnvC family protein [Nonomuraea sp. H19]|uniref:murein hydrolase activator EnvC family protein n=1 Tax=Nonomuraea sp. H19 TaxID=3452206 RepID=UPI003F8C79BD
MNSQSPAGCRYERDPSTHPAPTPEADHTPTRAHPTSRSASLPAAPRALLTLVITAAILASLPAPAASASPAGWRWPLDGHPRVIRRYAPPPEPWLAGHRGIDLAAPAATPVLAAGPGTVRFAGPVAGTGVVTIEHQGGLRTTYLPVAASVRRGQPVEPGAELGVVEASKAHCRQSCLHWGLLREDRYLDPLILLGHAPIRLLPFWPANPSGGTAAALTALLPGPTARPKIPSPASAALAAAPEDEDTAGPAPIATSRQTHRPTSPELLSRAAATHAAPAIGLAALLAIAFLITAVYQRRRHRRRTRRGPHNPRRGQHRKQRHSRHGGPPRRRRPSP